MVVEEIEKNDPAGAFVVEHPYLRKSVGNEEIPIENTLF